MFIGPHLGAHSFTFALDRVPVLKISPMGPGGEMESTGLGTGTVAGTRELCRAGKPAAKSARGGLVSGKGWRGICATLAGLFEYLFSNVG